MTRALKQSDDRRASTAFRAAWPLSLKEVLATPSIWAEHVLAGVPGLRAPGLPMLRDLAEFAGHSWGAVRTALSRGRASGEVECFQDAEGALRLRLSAVQRAVGEAVGQRAARPEGFLLAVASFCTEEEAGRRRVREVLGWFGFARIAHNAWACGLVDPAGVEAALARARVADHVFLFRCPGPQAASLERRLARAFDLRGRAAELLRFRRLAGAFLDERGLDPVTRGRRLLYAGPVFHEVCFGREPPLPASCLPAGYPLDEVRAWFHERTARGMADLVAYWEAHA